MKPITVLSLVGLCSPLFVCAQTASPANSSSTYIHCSEFFESKPMRDLPDYKAEVGAGRREAADRKRNLMRHKDKAFHATNDYSDPVRQTTYGSVAGSIAPIENFQGTTDSIWDPGDPNGAVDSTYYVQAMNVTYSVFDKHGNLVMPAKDLGGLWNGDPQDGDPVILYDKFADRWLLTEFQVTNTPYQFCVAVSKTNDPTGAYYVWKFSMGNTDPDYPKYSIWSDGYYITFQGFGFVNVNVPQQVAVLERNRMIKGDPNAGMVLGNLPVTPNFCGGNNSLFAAPKTLDCDASALPPFGTPEYLVYFENIASGGYSNSVVMDKLVFDTNAKTLTITAADSFPVSNFNAYFSNGNLTDISQPGDLHGVDALDGTFNFRVPFMEFTGYNSVVMSNTVNLGGMVAGIRWYELRQDAITKVWSLHQQGTYGPNDGISRWNGAICEDYNGDIALAYSVADSVSVYPGIRYTGRLQGDAAGQMTFAEQTAIAGTKTLSGTFGRWGDYSELDIDPADGLTFWCTNQYNTSNNNYTQMNRIFSFKLATSVGIEGVQSDAGIKVYQNGNYLEVNVAGLPSNDNLVVDLFDVSGRQLTTQNVVPVSNAFETKINVNTLPGGVYFVRVGRMGFQRVVKTVLK
jgi:hypothetical protein